MAAIGSTSSVSGLVSGLDTATIVSKLMDIEGRPQTLLKGQLNAAKTTARALREVNTALATLSSAAEALTGGGAFTGRTATSTGKDVGVTAAAAALPGTSVTFTVTGLASAQTSLSSATWSSRTAASAPRRPPTPPSPCLTGRSPSSPPTARR